jgi:hypothetical protein
MGKTLRMFLVMINVISKLPAFLAFTIVLIVLGIADAIRYRSAGMFWSGCRGYFEGIKQAHIENMYYVRTGKYFYDQFVSKEIES